MKLPLASGIRLDPRYLRFFALCDLKGTCRGTASRFANFFPDFPQDTIDSRAPAVSNVRDRLLREKFAEWRCCCYFAQVSRSTDEQTSSVQMKFGRARGLSAKSQHFCSRSPIWECNAFFIRAARGGVAIFVTAVSRLRDRTFRGETRARHAPSRDANELSRCSPLKHTFSASVCFNGAQFSGLICDNLAEWLDDKEIHAVSRSEHNAQPPSGCMIEITEREGARAPFARCTFPRDAASVGALL